MESYSLAQKISFMKKYLLQHDLIKFKSIHRLKITQIFINKEAKKKTKMKGMAVHFVLVAKSYLFSDVFSYLFSYVFSYIFSNSTGLNNGIKW